MIPQMMTQEQINALQTKSERKGNRGGMSSNQFEMMKTAHMKQFNDQMSDLKTVYLEVTNVTEDAGVVKKVVKHGDGPMPNVGQEVLIKFGAHVQGEPSYDSSDKRKGPMKITVGTNQMMEGLDMGILTMRLGEKSEFIIQPKYGYGAIGSPPQVPPNSILDIVVEVLAIGDRRPSKWSMDENEIMTTALRLKDDGNAKFKEGKLREAENLYRDGVYHMDNVKKDDEESNKLRITLCQNTALMLNKQQKYSDAIHFCTKAIKVDPKALKAYYFRQQAYIKTRQWDEAIDDLKAAIKLNPQDKNLRKEFEAAKEKRLASQKKAANSMKGMFSNGIYEEKEEAVGHQKFDKLPEFDPENVQCWFEVAIGDKDEPNKTTGKVYFELFSKIVTKGAENFKVYCEGDRAWCYSYKDCIFHKIVPDKYVHGGDVDCHTGRGGLSIYGKRYDDENIWLPHTHKGILTNAVTKDNDNSCQFLITYAAMPELNLHNTVFGRVIKNWDFIEDWEDVGIDNDGKPLKRIEIIGAGVLEGDKKLSKQQCDALWIYDM